MLAKTDSGSNKQVIQPKQWTLISFGKNKQTSFISHGAGKLLFNVILRVEYPEIGCPRTLRGRFVRWPNTTKSDETGHNDVNPIAGLTRHHHWSHFLENRSKMPVGFIVWHDGENPVVLDGRQIKSFLLN
jgi:hypothetical protein